MTQSPYLPPGVTWNQIPGDRPIDQYHDLVMEAVRDEIWQKYSSLSTTSDFVNTIDSIIDDGFEKGIAPDIAALKINMRF